MHEDQICPFLGGYSPYAVPVYDNHLGTRGAMALTIAKASQYYCRLPSRQPICAHIFLTCCGPLFSPALLPTRCTGMGSNDPCVLVTNARSLVTRFEKLGRDWRMILVVIPETSAGILAAASLQWEDKINVNLKGVMHWHVATCSQAGVAAVTIPVALGHFHRKHW